MTRRGAVASELRAPQELGSKTSLVGVGVLSPANTRNLATRPCLESLRGEGGANLIEMAIVLPVYFLLVFTLISFAIVLFAYGNATFAGKSAVRYAVVHGALSVTPCSATDLQNIVTPYLWGAPPGGVTVTSQWSPSNAVGSTVSVTVQLAYSTGLPYGYLNNLVVSTTAEGIILH